MTHKSIRTAVTLSCMVIAISIGLVTDSKPALAHLFVRFIGQPYYGHSDYSQRWIDDPDPNKQHDGIDFILSWAPVLAAASGNVDFAGWDNLNCHDRTQCTGNTSGFGLHVRINHSVNGETNYTYYGHLSVARTTMGAVSQGQWIGTSGDSGNSSGPHLHFEVRHGCSTYGHNAGCAVNPDNAGGTGVKLWSVGEWYSCGSRTCGSQPRKRFVTLSTYGTDTIIDNDGPGFHKGRAGSLECPPNTCAYWYFEVAGYLGTYYYTLDNDYTVDYWAEWRANLPGFANYEVSAYMPCRTDNPNDYTSTPTWRAPYEVRHYDGSTPLLVDQLTLSRIGPYPDNPACNRWLALGVYRGNSAITVRVTDATGEAGSIENRNVARKVLADAVKFTQVNVGPFEGELYRKRIPRSSHSWEFNNMVAGYDYTGYMEALPNNGNNGNDPNFNNDPAHYSPEMKWNVVFPTAGTYYVWVHGFGGDANDDSVHAGMDNQLAISADRISCPEWSGLGWRWCKTTMDNSDATLTVTTPGLHVFNLYMREDGFRADQIRLSPAAYFDPLTMPSVEIPYILPTEILLPDDPDDEP